MNTIHALYRLWVTLMHRQFGGEMATPKFSNSESANVPSAGNIFYCIKPLSANATIESAKDASGVVITDLANVTIAKGDEYKDYFSEITFTDSTIVRLYERTKTDNQNY